MGKRLIVELTDHQYNNILAVRSINMARAPYKGIVMSAINAIKRGVQVPEDMDKAAEILKAFPEIVPVSERMPNIGGYYIVFGGGKTWISECLDLMGHKGWVGSVRTPIVEEWLDLVLPKSFILDAKIKDAIQSVREARRDQNE